jgi:hypothetical protein
MTVVTGESAVPKSLNEALAVPDELNKAELLERLTALGATANRHDAKAKELLAFCRAHPEAWTMLRTLEQDTIDRWLTLLAPGTHGDTHKAEWNRSHINEQLRRRREALRADGESPLEELLISRILSAWLMTMEADQAYTALVQRGGTFKEGEYHQKRVDRAQRQLLRAIQSLATVRRLLTPMQVNIGQNQINLTN